MAKRQANKQITHDNWNDEEEEEEPGYFTPAGEERLKGRPIRKAKRRLVEQNGKTSSPFAKFAGLVGSNTSTPSSPFSFLKTQSTSNANGLEASKSTAVVPPVAASLSKTDGTSSPFGFIANKPATNGNGFGTPKSGNAPPATEGSFFKPNLSLQEKPVSSIPFSFAKNSASDGKSANVVVPPSIAAVSKSEPPLQAKSFGSPSFKTYVEKLKELNLAFVSWIQEHMNKNVYIDFTPVCSDYIRQAKNLEETSTTAALETTTNTNVTASATTTAINSPALQTVKDAQKLPVHQRAHPDLMQEPAKKSVALLQKSPVSFSFLAKRDNAETASAPSIPFTFSSQVASKTEPKGTTDNDEEYVPPKNEFEAVTEADAIYSKRCKMFFKKDSNYAEKGKGTLFLKQLGDKTQLLMRADTSLGNILLNIELLSTLPLERVGKNNVMIVCVPYNPQDPKAKADTTPVLFRVKTPEDADELLEKLNQYKR